MTPMLWMMIVSVYGAFTLRLFIDLVLAPMRERRNASQGADRKPQPPTRSIVGGPGEDQSVATLDHTSNR